MMNYVNFLIQLTERDKRLLVALFIVLILVFVLIAYIGQGLRQLMKRYSKGIDGYMHDLCKAKLVKTPREFRKQVFVKETKVLYRNTRWVFRVFIISMIGFVVYSLIVKPGGENTPFGYVGYYLGDLLFKMDCPKGNFFGIKNFPIDWPYFVSSPKVYFTLPSIISYIMLLVWVFTFFGVFTNTLKFIARLGRARTKSVEVFSHSLDDANFSEDL